MSSTSVGWDTTLSGGQSAWSTPLPDSGSSSAADATSGLIDKTREVKVDANDYSRFKNIGGDDDDDKANTSASVSPGGAASAVETCRNCHKPGAKLKCSVCKKAVYCARTCQASDWTFHKRICKKPEVKKPEPPRKRPATDTTTTTASSSSSSSSASATTSSSKSSVSSSSSTKKPTTSSSSTEVVVDDPDLPTTDLRGYKNGMPYFHRELSENEQKLIGDIAPKKVEVVHEVSKPVVHEGSAWNAAGTFEERTFTKWAEDKWSELLSGKVFNEGEYEATLGAPDKITGDASICVVRGKKRYLFDFCFKLPFEVTLAGTKYTGNFQLNEISNDEEYEISYKLTKKPPTVGGQLAALQKFVSGGLQKEMVRIIGEFNREFQNQ